MATRRSFLLSAGLAPALSAAPAGSPIAQLKNRRGEAQPITTAERRARIERAQQLMAETRSTPFAWPAARRSTISAAPVGATASACS